MIYINDINTTLIDYCKDVQNTPFKLNSSVVYNITIAQRQKKQASHFCDLGSKRQWMGGSGCKNFTGELQVFIILLLSLLKSQGPHYSLSVLSVEKTKCLMVALYYADSNGVSRGIKDSWKKKRQLSNQLQFYVYNQELG